ncbi:hypothetical protein ACFYZN_19460 [Streptomyces sp. NPDC001777]|uniref:hypothetical protein n=1 Tax=Streptomyces sp. NPDC001777 TaxID=3364608 RepID=UPI00368776C2
MKPSIPAAQGQKWLVLDVDRTLINTTSWYRACVTPGLLLTPDAAARFKAANERTYGPAPSLSEAAFRELTLDLLNSSSPSGWSADRMRDAGRRIARDLSLYPEVAAYLRQVRQGPEPVPRILFLSAGHQPFIEGVVEGLLRGALLSGLPYEVVGSTLEFTDGNCAQGVVLDGDGKAAVVSQLLDIGAEIVLLADDNYHDHPMFERVEKLGGRALRVRHEPGRASSRSWREFLAGDPHLDLQARLAGGDTRYALDRTRAATERYVDRLDGLPPTDNSIGIGTVDADVFTAALDALCGQIAAPDEAAHLHRYVLSCVYADGDRLRLRGRLYHLDTPPYLLPEHSTSRERWWEALDGALDAAATLDRAALPGRWPGLPAAQRWIVLCILDHLKNAATHALDVLTRTGLTDGAADALDAELEALVEDSHLAYWSAVFATPRLDVVHRATAWRRLHALVQECVATPFRMRELDDPAVIARSVLSLVQQLEERGEWPTGIVDFQSGALDLGLAFATITRLTRPHRPAVDVAHVVYSSKDLLRGHDHAAPPDLDSFVSRVAKHFRERLYSWLNDDGLVLLYDNNVTTFTTLAVAKRALGTAQARIHAAVACVNYDNIARRLRGLPGEELSKGWQDVLDYQPVTDYVTAFATWGTSVKTRELHRMYAAPAEVPPLPAAAAPGPVDAEDPQRLLFKVCRVHNPFDLAAVVAAGAHAIGVHAVSPPEPVYSAGQERHHPLDRVPVRRPNLPLAHYETEAIRLMATMLPVGLKVVVVMERVPTRRDWHALLTALGLPASSALQLQCRVTAAQLVQLRLTVPAGLVCAVGADQEDFEEYFRFLDGALDPRTDHILVDHSVHQPDLIAAGVTAVAPARARVQDQARAMRGNRIAVLVADDTSARTVVDRCAALRAHGVLVAGCDTQNSVEVPKQAQRYRLIKDAPGAQALVRKCPDRLREWASALSDS